jgi:excisionase family DNA binding protein
MHQPIFLTVPEAAKVLGIGRSTAWNLVKKGELAVIKIGGSTKVPRSAIEGLAKGRIS